MSIWDLEGTHLHLCGIGVQDKQCDPTKLAFFFFFFSFPFVPSLSVSLWAVCSKCNAAREWMKASYGKKSKW